jgi:hypothetical protein
MKKTTHAVLELLAVAAIACAGCDRAQPTSPGPGATSPPSASAGKDLTYEEVVALISNPDHFAVARDLGERLPTLGPGSLPALKQAFRDSADLEFDAVSYELLMRYWALHEPEEAAMFALVSAPRAYRVAAIYATVRPWAAKDPQKAIESTSMFARDGGDGGTATQNALVRGWFDSGKPGLEQYIRDLGQTFERQRAVVVYATEMARTHRIEELVRWADSIPDDDPAFKIDAFRGVATALVPIDLAAAQRFCDARCDGPYGKKMRDRVTTAWLQKDGAAALEWLANSPPQDGQRDVSLRFNYLLWADQHPKAAMQWFEEKRAQNPRPDWVASMTPVYARVFGRTRPEEALVIADEITGPVDRDGVKVAILREWRQRDEASAEAWLKKSSLSDDMLARVREPQTIVEKNVLEDRRRRGQLPEG